MKVNQDICIGCGACVGVADKIFAMQKGKAIVIKKPESKEELAGFRVGQMVCPVWAIEDDE